MEDGACRFRLMRGESMDWAILPVPRNVILEKMSEAVGVAEKKRARVRVRATLAVMDGSVMERRLWVS
jgi:hypothetical protein